MIGLLTFNNVVRKAAWAPHQHRNLHAQHGTTAAAGATVSISAITPINRAGSGAAATTTTAHDGDADADDSPAAEAAGDTASGEPLASVAAPSPSTRCGLIYDQSTSWIRKSLKIRSIAQEFIGSVLYRKKFLAVHVRPYHDECLLAVWMHRTYSMDKAERLCANANLYNVFVPQSVEAILEHQLQRVVILTHPKIMFQVINRLKADAPDVKLATFNMKRIEKVLGYQSVTALAMVEEEVAVRADVFIGTIDSSMTGMILQEREAMGQPANTSRWFRGTRSKKHKVMVAQRKRASKAARTAEHHRSSSSRRRRRLGA